MRALSSLATDDETPMPEAKTAKWKSGDGAAILRLRLSSKHFETKLGNLLQEGKESGLGHWRGAVLEIQGEQIEMIRYTESVAQNEVIVKANTDASPQCIKRIVLSYLEVPESSISWVRPTDR